MTGVAEILMFLALLEGQGGGGGNAPAPAPSPGPVPPPAPFPGPYAPQPAPAPMPQAPVPGIPYSPAPQPAPAPVPAPPPRQVILRRPTPAPWPAPVKPAGLPPFPGPGWTACSPLSPAIIARAAYWNPILWNYASQTIRQASTQEQLGGQWITFAAAWHPDANGTPHKLMATEAWCLASPGPSPAPTPSQPLNSGVAQVGPEPELGGWQTDAAFIKRYQNALSYLSFTKNQAAWNTHGVDGQAGPNTQAAVRAFQAANGLTADGQCGSATASVIDTMLGYPVPAGGYPAPGGGAAPAPADPGDPSAFQS